MIAYRVDMDALDLNEKLQPDHLPFREGFASCNSGMMHACGHDGHTTIGLGLAHVFKSLEPQLNGTIKLIFQPAEEGTRGAKSMVEAGVVDDVDFFTAVHIGTGVPAGELVCGSDSFMATSKLDVTYRGVAAHARPNRKMAAMRCWRRHRPRWGCTPFHATAKAARASTSVCCRQGPVVM